MTGKEDKQKNINEQLAIDEPFESPEKLQKNKNSKDPYVIEIKFPKETKDISSEVVGLKGALDRDTKYTEILQAYLDHYKSDKEVANFQKKSFYWIVITLFGIVLLLSLVCIVLCIFFENENSLAVIISSGVSLLGSIIALPMTIAKHLFPASTDDQIVKVVNFMLDNDRSIRETQINSIHHEQSDKK
jgi:hypothetical protein